MEVAEVLWHVLVRFLGAVQPGTPVRVRFTGQGRTRQDKAGQGRTRQDKAGQGRTRQDKAGRLRQLLACTSTRVAIGMHGQLEAEDWKGCGKCHMEYPARCEVCCFNLSW
jgi:hypothetical protein